MNSTRASLLSIAALVASGLALPASANEKKLTFDDLMTVAANGDITVCQKRYGAGYKTSPSDKGKMHRVTDTGHEFEIVATEMFDGKGTVTFHNTYQIMFAGESNPVDAEVWATGLKGNPRFTGTFTDGTCRGHVEFTQ
jgi:hypothetical protein